jgi:hypothetical protein
MRIFNYGAVIVILAGATWLGFQGVLQDQLVAGLYTGAAGYLFGTGRG